MLFDNPIFTTWYTDTADVYRVVTAVQGNISKQKRHKVNDTPVLCRVYSSKRGGPVMGKAAAAEKATEKMSCDLSADIKVGDELLIVRGGALGMKNEPERYFAGNPQSFYSPVGGVFTGLQHKEVGLLLDNLIGTEG